MARRRTPRGEEASHELTSMIDVTFLLLVFFVCTMQFRILEGKLPTHLPTDRGDSAVPSVADVLETLEIRLDRDRRATDGVRIRCGFRVVDGNDGVGALVAAAVSNQPDLRARVTVGDGVTHGQVVSVVDACLAGGLTDIAFAAIPL